MNFEVGQKVRYVGGNGALRGLKGVVTRANSSSTRVDVCFPKVRPADWSVEAAAITLAEAEPIIVKPGDWLNSLSSAERKEVAMARGLMAYFPDALALIARHSVRMNEKHNPGQEVHWSRDKSTDHDDCIIRHSANVANDPDSLDSDGAYHMICRGWRSLAAIQVWAEKKHAKGEKI